MVLALIFSFFTFLSCAKSPALRDWSHPKAKFARLDYSFKTRAFTESKNSLICETKAAQMALENCRLEISRFFESNSSFLDQEIPEDIQYQEALAIQRIRLLYTIKNRTKSGYQCFAGAGLRSVSLRESLGR